jgi:quercetin dioxygenase-like cupin family protein
MANERRGIVIAPEQGTLWNMTEDRFANLKLFGAQTGDTLAVFEETVPVETDTLLHLHHDSDETIYVLEGEIAIRIGEQVQRGGPGTWAFIPRQTAHAWKNVGAAAARAMFIFTPAKAARFFEELSRQPAPINELDPNTITALLHESGWAILGPSGL